MVHPPATPAASPPSGFPSGLSAAEELTAEELLAWRRSLLAQGGQPADLDWLLDLGAGLPWAALQQLWLHPERPVRLQRPRHEIEALWRRHLHASEPLQYLVGRCPWRDLELQVAPGVLIPRQETELLVELALQLLPVEGHRQPLLWADLGTGSGCLAVALARELPASRGLAVDVSAEALALARRNLERAGALERVQPLSSHWWQALAPWLGRFQLVLANPPYIPSREVDTLEPLVRDHEPRLALDGGQDGLDAIRAIAAGAVAALAPAGHLLIEHHHDQSGAVLGLLRAAGLEAVTPHRDLEGIWRFASARAPGQAG